MAGCRLLPPSYVCRRLLLGGVQAGSNSRSTSKPVSQTSRRGLKSMYGGRYLVTMLPGHGIGPEMMSHVESVFARANVPVDFERVEVDDTPGSLESALLSIRRNGVALKGNVETENPLNVEPRNLALRNGLQLDVNVVHCRNHPGIRTRHNDIDIVVIRQNTEGEYSRLEHASAPGVVESLKIITRQKSTEIARYAFNYARTHKRKKVTVVHKANIMKLSDGLFLKSCLDVAREYPDIAVEDMIIDNCCMQLVRRPSQFDVMLVPNLYGNILVNMACGLTGGPGITSGRNYGREFAVFETATRNTGSYLVGKNLANPAASLFAAVDMLKHLGLRDHAYLIKDAVEKTLNEDRIHTQDLGGMATTTDVVDNVLREVSRHTTVPLDNRPHLEEPLRTHA
ncbi:isocitrate dehydrogenase [NAD] subunit gamma, mitochondrial [Rhipicephalus microplus]|uniref:isocitrate dehydrogenase [NAD] subunit gamma, mitochondrial n=1 Tax=Rhipicephalus microplus TaxID=6941 RepID=UPI003F6AB709